MRDYTAAQTILERVLDLTLIRKKEQQDKAVTVQSLDFDLVLHLNLVFLFIQMDELAEARDCLAEADAIFPHLRGHSQSRYRAHYHAIRGLLLFAQGRFADAADAVAQAGNPDYPACLRVPRSSTWCAASLPRPSRCCAATSTWSAKHGTTHRPELRDHMLELAESLFGQDKHDEAFAAVAEARTIVADFTLPADATWRRTLQSWAQRARRWAVARRLRRSRTSYSNSPRSRSRASRFRIASAFARRYPDYLGGDRISKGATMDEMMLLRMTGGLGSGLDLAAVLIFIAFAVIYFLAPLVTHTRERPAALAIALYLMVGYAAISLVQLLLQWSGMTNAGGGFGMPGRTPMAVHLLFAFGALKAATVVIAMIAFVVGLHSLRFKDPETRAFEQAVEKLQQLRDENVRLRKRLERDASEAHDGL